MQQEDWRTTTVQTQDRGAILGAANSAFIEWLRQLPLFRVLNPEECAEVVGLAYEKEFARGTLFYSEGSVCRHVLLLLSGCVKITQLAAAGTEVLLHVCGPGELIGALEASMGVENRVNAAAIQPTMALVWKRAEFEGAMDRNPKLQRSAVRLLGQRLQFMEDRFHGMSTQKVPIRLSQELVRLTKHLRQPSNPDALEICLSREELAQLTGTTMCTVSRLLAEWERRGILGSRRGVVVVRKLESLRALADSES